MSWKLVNKKGRRVEVKMVHPCGMNRLVIPAKGSVSLPGVLEAKHVEKYKKLAVLGIFIVRDESSSKSIPFSPPRANSKLNEPAPISLPKPYRPLETEEEIKDEPVLDTPFESSIEVETLTDVEPEPLVEEEIVEEEIVEDEEIEPIVEIEGVEKTYSQVTKKELVQLATELGISVVGKRKIDIWNDLV